MCSLFLLTAIEHTETRELSVSHRLSPYTHEDVRVNSGHVLPFLFMDT